MIGIRILLIIKKHKKKKNKNKNPLGPALLQKKKSCMAHILLFNASIFLFVFFSQLYLVQKLPVYT